MYVKEILKFSSRNCIIKNKIRSIEDKMEKLWECKGE